MPGMADLSPESTGGLMRLILFRRHAEQFLHVGVSAETAVTHSDGSFTPRIAATREW